MSLAGSMIGLGEMSTKRQQFSSLMTSGVDIRGVLLKSLCLATLCVVFTVPYFYHMLSVSMKTQTQFSMPHDFFTVMSLELILLFFVCFLSAMSGFSFSTRFQLPGVGDLHRFKETFPVLLIVAVVVGGFTYLFFDRHFFYMSPESYPKNTLYLVSYPFKLAFTNEVVLRFGLVTLAVGFLKQRIGGVIAISAIAAIFSLKYFRFLGMDYPYNYVFICQFIIAFFVNFILGYILITRGLIYAMTLHFLFGIRLAVVVWILG